MEVWGKDLWEIFLPIIVKLGPARVLATLADEDSIGGAEPDDDVDYGALSDVQALEMLDRRATDPEWCALLAAEVATAFGKEMGRVEFDSGFPGTAQARSIWRLGGWWFAVNSNIGVYEVYETAKEARKALEL